MSRAKLCLVCGYAHPNDAAQVDLCEHCGARLDGATSEFPQRLLEQPTVRTQQRDRISSDEEERAREGYHITTHYRFAPNAPIGRAEVRDADQTLLEVLSAPQAELWRINHGWRRSTQRMGFTVDETGRWQKREDDEVEDDDTAGDPAARALVGGVKPYVTDRRNVLLLRPAADAPERDAFMKTLAYTLQRGIQVVYQVEEQEVAVELIGQGEEQRLLLWEAAEGGTGVWERILTDPGSFAAVAAEALRICHFLPDGSPEPEWNARCARACYDCLLSYRNQFDHRFLD